ncbi:19250_t:CDS:2, partial [Funneliformis geosporum]
RDLAIAAAIKAKLANPYNILHQFTKKKFINKTSGKLENYWELIRIYIGNFKYIA